MGSRWSRCARMLPSQHIRAWARTVKCTWRLDHTLIEHVLPAGIRSQDSCGSTQASRRGRAHLSYALHLILLPLGNKWQRLICLGVQDATPCREVLSVAH